MKVPYFQDLLFASELMNVALRACSGSNPDASAQRKASATPFAEIQAEVPRDSDTTLPSRSVTVRSMRAASSGL